MSFLWWTTTLGIRGCSFLRRKGSRFAHAAFVATFEPKDIGHTLSDHNWVNSMHEEFENFERNLSYGPPRAHYLGGYQDRLLGGPLGLPGLRCTAPDGVRHKDCGGEVLG
jgi:hypothetical protein